MCGPPMCIHSLKISVTGTLQNRRACRVEAIWNQILRMRSDSPEGKTSGPTCFLFLAYFPKKRKVRLMRSVRLSPLITFEPIGTFL
jgi:hypothetical protein